MRLPTCISYVVPIVLASTPALAAQESALRPGQRVRLVAPTALAGTFEGAILERHADTLIVASVGGATQRVPVAAVTEARVSMGPSRRRGASKGALIGAVIGASLSTLFILPALGDEDAHVSGGDVALYFYQMTGGCALWGAGIGAIVRAERWERLSITPVASPDRGTLRVGLTHHF